MFTATLQFDTRNPDPETRNPGPKPDTQNPNPGTPRNIDLDVRIANLPLLLALSNSICAHEFGEPKLFSTPKLANV